MNVNEILEALGNSALLVDGHNNAIMGLAEKNNQITVLYDKEIMLKNLVEEGMTRIEAEEYFDFNIAGSLSDEDVAPVYLTYRVGEAERKMRHHSSHTPGCQR